LLALVSKEPIAASGGINVATREKEKTMKMLAFAALVAVLTFGSATGMALADDTCQSKAVGKDGKLLAGAALTSFMTKCLKDTCAAKAIDKNGKPLAGAAKDSFMKKCQSGG
jgi:hypothetical protein